VLQAGLDAAHGRGDAAVAVGPVVGAAFSGAPRRQLLIGDAVGFRAQAQALPLPAAVVGPAGRVRAAWWWLEFGVVVPAAKVGVQFTAAAPLFRNRALGARRMPLVPMDRARRVIGGGVVTVVAVDSHAMRTLQARGRQVRVPP